MRLTMIWLFTIVRAAVHHPAAQRQPVRPRSHAALRGACCSSSSLSLIGMSWWGRRHRDLLWPTAPGGRWVNEPIPDDRGPSWWSPSPYRSPPEHRRVPAVRCCSPTTSSTGPAQAPVAAAAAGLTAPSSSRHGSSPRSVPARSGGRPGLPVDPEPPVDPAPAAHGLHRDAVLGVAELAGDTDRGLVAVQARDETAQSAPRPAKARCSTAARISVPMPRPWCRRPSQEPVCHLTGDRELGAADALDADRLAAGQHRELERPSLRGQLAPTAATGTA